MEKNRKPGVWQSYGPFLAFSAIGLVVYILAGIGAWTVLGWFW